MFALCVPMFLHTLFTFNIVLGNDISESERYKTTFNFCNRHLKNFIFPGNRECIPDVPRRDVCRCQPRGFRRLPTWQCDRSLTVVRDRLFSSFWQIDEETFLDINSKFNVSTWTYFG